MKILLSFKTLELSIRIFTSFFIFIYGVGKTVQFKNAKLLDTSIRDATGAEMMWAFFGTTMTYPLVIGSLQVLGAILLLFQRTKLIGALLLTPIFFNIILLDILFEINLGALMNAVVFQSVLLWVIFQERQRVWTALQSLRLDSDPSVSFRQHSLQFILATFMGAGLFFLYQYLIKLF